MKHHSVLLLAAIAMPASAHAAGFDAHNFHLYAADGQPVAPLKAPSPFITRGFFGAAVFEYAESPLVRAPVGSDGNIDFDNAETVLDDVMALNLNLGWAPIQMLRFDVGLPLYVSSVGTLGANDFAPGDVRVAATVGWSKEEQRGFGVGVTPWVTIPMGGDAAFLGESGVAGGGDLSLGFHGEKFLVAAGAGYAYKPDISLDNLTGSDQIAVSAVLGYEVVEHLGINAELHAGLPLGTTTVPGSDTPVELIGHAKYQLPVGLNFLLGGAGGLSNGAGTPAYRVFVGVGYGPVLKKGPPPPPPDLDADDDGILDDVDACKTDPETVNNFKDTDGCPDGIGDLTVTTTVGGKSVPGAITLTGPAGAQTGTGSIKVEKAEPGSNWSAKGSYLCYAGEGSTAAKEGNTDLAVELKPMRDAKAAVEVVDKKGKVIDAATVKWDTKNSGDCVPGGAPVALAGGKGVIDVGAGKHRVFVTAKDMTNYTGEFTFTAGQTTDIRVELDTTRIKLEAKQIVILDKVFFETNKDVIKAESFKLLDEVASVILANPQVGRVAIGGHTYSDGNDAANLDLSQRRAEAVKRYIEGKGVAADQLQAKGYGEGKPVDSNKSAKGKTNNRRVEFQLVDQANPAGAIEVAPGTPGATPTK